MPFPVPEVGLVISYAYLWRYEQQSGYEEGRKTRPCVIVLAVQKKEEGLKVTVAPITHTPPQEDAAGLEIPPAIKKHLGLDDMRSWVIMSEVNQFIWPGYDLHPTPSAKGKYDYGFLPPKFFGQIKSGILDLSMKKRHTITLRN